MNPRLTITIDERNRAIAVASGMLTVGAKVDISISGLPDAIPQWVAGDSFVGASLRFRLVDLAGHDLARYPLAVGDKWDVEGDEYLTTTPAEFDTDALRNAFFGVVFNDYREFGIIIDSALDDAQYATGRVKVRQWAVASTEDPTVLPDWRETLKKLREDLASVSGAKNAAETARDEAVSAKNAAETARNEAVGAMGAAETARDEAVSAKNAAETARDEAVSAKNAAEAASGKISAHLENYNNPHQVTASQVGAYTKSEADAALAKETARATEAEASNACTIATHMADKDNPHQVTASQVGAYTKGETDEAIKAEADRAKAAEAAETERAKKAESANADAITAEADRAKAAEEALAESLKKVAEYMAGESILLATNLINGVQHYAKQIMRYDADMAAWGAEWEGDYTFVDGDGEVPDVYCRAYKDGVEAGYVKQTLAWDKDMNAWGAVWTASDYTPAADEAKDLYVKTTFTDGVQYYTKQTVVWDADMNDWGAVWDGTYILYRGKFMKKGK